MTDSNVHEFKPRVVEEKPQAPTTIEEDLEGLVTKARQLQSDLDEAQGELERTQADLTSVSMAYDDLEEAMGAALSPVVDLFDEIHRDAGHSGPWTLCHDRLCRRLEEWTHHRRRDLER